MIQGGVCRWHLVMLVYIWSCLILHVRNEVKVLTGCSLLLLSLCYQVESMLQKSERLALTYIPQCPTFESGELRCSWLVVRDKRTVQHMTQKPFGLTR